VAHHGNFGFGEARDQFEATLAAFDLYGFGTGSFTKRTALRRDSAVSL